MALGQFPVSSSQRVPVNDNPLILPRLYRRSILSEFIGGTIQLDQSASTRTLELGSTDGSEVVGPEQAVVAGCEKVLEIEFLSRISESVLYLFSRS